MKSKIYLILLVFLIVSWQYMYHTDVDFASSPVGLTLAGVLVMAVLCGVFGRK